MRIPAELAHGFENQFQSVLSQFLTDQGALPEGETLDSKRFLARSIAPHVSKLSQVFNRMDDLGIGPDQGTYWKTGQNTANLRTAYLLGFMPPNLFRVASVWAELHRLGYRWPTGGPVRAIDLGAGPATAACGIAAGEKYCPIGLPEIGNWALIDRDKAILELGAKWADVYRQSLELPAWEHRKFHRKIEPGQLLPTGAPRFHLWLQSYFLNECINQNPGQLADNLLQTWDRHLENEGLVIWVEPALKKESRRLLSVRKEILKRIEAKSAEKETGGAKYQVLLPCLGHQTCGALEDETDWCHEESVWWRPAYLRRLDEMTGLDRKSLPFSYLVLTRSRRTRQEILPGLLQAATTHRLVSPARKEGRDLEFYTCGADGKRRSRLQTRDELERGDILLDADVRGDANSGRIEVGAKRV